MVQSNLVIKLLRLKDTDTTVTKLLSMHEEIYYHNQLGIRVVSAKSFPTEFLTFKYVFNTLL